MNRVDDDRTRLLRTGEQSGDEQRTRLLTGGGGRPTATGAHGGRTARPERAILKQRFVLQEMLGSGGMGTVYRAVDLRKREAGDSDPFVAVKLLNDDFRQHPDAFVTLQREAHKSQTLAHPNIVNVYDFDRDGDTVFMTMECLDGQSLDRLLREHPDGLPYAQAVAVLRDVCAALGYAHTHQIAHSDFKPGNVFVTGRGSKVLDFGIARAVTRIELKAVDRRAAQTRFDASSLGALTPAYASLDMLRGLAPELCCDVYALGCVAYELFSGRHPFAGRTALQAQQQGLVPQRIRSLPRRQWRALERALAFERAQRLATVDELLAAFKSRGRQGWWAIAAAVVIGLGAALAVVQQRMPEVIDIGSLRADLESELKQQWAAREVDRLLRNIHFDAGWIQAFTDVFEDYAETTEANDPDLLERRHRLVAALLEEADRQREARAFAEARRLLQAASEWSRGSPVLGDSPSGSPQ